MSVPSGAAPPLTMRRAAIGPPELGPATAPSFCGPVNSTATNWIAYEYIVQDTERPEACGAEAVLLSRPSRRRPGFSGPKRWYVSVRWQSSGQTLRAESG